MTNIYQKIVNQMFYLKNRCFQILNSNEVKTKMTKLKHGLQFISISKTIYESIEIITKLGNFLLSLMGSIVG